MTLARHQLALSLVMLISLICSHASAKNVALLVGVGKYQAGKHLSLEGPEYDVDSMRKVLSKKWGFAWKDIHVLSTRAGETKPTKQAILNKLRWVQQNTEAGDNIFFYFSGHGTSRYDADSRQALPIPHHSGAIMPYDAVLKANSQSIVNSLIIGRTDLRPILTEMDNSNKFVTVVFDSCFSGSAVRSAGVAKNCSSTVRGQYVDQLNGGRKPARFSCRYAKVVLPPMDIAGMPPITGLRPPPPPYPYKNVAFLSAASDSEKAMDISVRNLQDNPDLTYDQQPHGAFTNYLLSVLDGQISADSDGDSSISYRELQKVLVKTLNRNGFGHKPQFLPQSHKDTKQLATRSLFNAGKITTSTVEYSPLRVRMNQGDNALINGIEGVQSVTSAADIVVTDQQQHWVLLSEAGDLLGRIDKAATASSALARRLGQLASIHRLEQWGEQNNPFAFNLNLAHETRGGVVKKGEKIAFHFSTTKPAWVVILDYNSLGEIVNLYPYFDTETAKQPAYKTVFLPGEKQQDWILVNEPLGRDKVIAFAFSKRPAFLNQLVGKDKLAYQGLYKQLLDEVNNNPASSAVAALDLLTVKYQEEAE